MITTGSTRFRPRARLIRLLGEELISDEVAAVVELVKNAYDADASAVSIRIVNAAIEGLIEIRDDGAGMSLETLLNAWLEPATSFKRRGGRKRRTALGRYPLGEKGVGRFAADKLGAELELVSRSRSSRDEVRLILSWEAFGDREYLDEIHNRWESRKPIEFSGRKHGTLLRITRLRTSWGAALVSRIHEGLSRLVSPSARASDFGIVLECPEFPEFHGRVRNRLLETAPYQLIGSVTADGNFEPHAASTQWSGVDLREHAGDHFRINRGRGLRMPACGPFGISLSVWDLDALGLGGVRMTRALRASLKRSNGISIYRDGFRVAPYGDVDNDWLELNRRRVNNPTLRVSTNQIVGVIEITQDGNPELRDRTSREGLIEHQALRDLKALAVSALSLLEEYRYARRKSAKPAPPGDDVDPVLAYIGQARIDSSGRAALSRAEHAYRQYRAETERREQALLRLASVGATAENLFGQVFGSIASLNRLLPLIERRLGDNAQLSALRKRMLLVDQQLDALEQLRSRTANAIVAVDLRAIAQDGLTIYAPLLAATSVQATLLADHSVVVRADRGAVLQALLHVLENAIAAAAVMTKYRWVELQVSSSPPSLLVRDSGEGVAPEKRAMIFDPFFTGREGRAGLGLYLARTLINSTGHEIELGPQGNEFRLLFNSRPPVSSQNGTSVGPEVGSSEPNDAGIAVTRRARRIVAIERSSNGSASGLVGDGIGGET